MRKNYGHIENLLLGYSIKNIVGHVVLKTKKKLNLNV